jgi:hypothetical protein
MPTFAEHLPGRLPTTLRGRWGAAFGRIFGAACDLVLDSAKDGVDWLRTVCRAGRATPVTAGGVWRL